MTPRSQYPTDLPKLGGALLKFRRAESHIRDFEREVSDFLDRDPYRVVQDYNPDSREYVFRIKVLEWPKDEWSAILGDAIHNLRSALDHIIYDLTIIQSGKALGGTAFPILTNESLWDEVDRKGKPTARSGLYKLRGVSDEVRDIVHNVQPFHAGENAKEGHLAMLNELSNADKHRTLTFCGTTVKQAEIRFFPPTVDRWVTGPGPFIDGQPLAVYTGPPDFQGEPHVELNISFEIALDERTPYEGAVVIPVLNTMAEAVLSALGMLTRFSWS